MSRPCGWSPGAPRRPPRRRSPAIPGPPPCGCGPSNASGQEQWHDREPQQAGGPEMSTLLSQARNRVPRIAEAAVERARLTVVPRTARRRAPRVPFVTLVSLLLVGGVAGLLFFTTSMQQASFTATD